MEPVNPDRSCKQCGTLLAEETISGLCPRCLLAMNFASRTMPGGEPSPQVPPPTPEQMAARFPQFEILECLGRGGMGVVYKARQKALERMVAIKVLAGELRDAPQFEARFSREAKTLAKLSHPNIVTVHDFGESDGMFYLVMEFVDGVNLRDVLRDGRLEATQALAIVPEICAALQFAHDHGVIHRDIKPENILLDRDGRVKIADFGIASLVGAAADRSGTPPYMAPEQEQVKGNIDHRADIYALGVVFYEMLTGERPDKDLVAPSRKVEIDVRLDELVLRALEKEPERRYQTAGEFRTVVQTIATMPPLVGRQAQATQTHEALGNPRNTEAKHWLDYTEPQRRVLLWYGFLVSLIGLPVGLALKLPMVWGLSIAGLLIAGTKLGRAWVAKRDLRVSNDRSLLPSHAETNGPSQPSHMSRPAAISGAILGAICGVMAVIYIGMLPSHSPWWQKLLLSLFISYLVAGVFVLGAWLAAKKPSQPGTPAAPTDDRTTGATQASRFSRTAVVGACWAALFLVMVLFSFLGHAVLGQYLPLKLLWLLVGTTAPFATTILGCVAISQIRRSAGRLRGLGLALFDALLFPLLALDVLIGFFWSWIVYDLIRASIIAADSPVSALTVLFVRHASEIVMLFTVPVALVLDYLIIRRAWRAVNKPVGTMPPADSSELPPASATSQRNGLGIGALVLCVASIPVLLLVAGRVIQYPASDDSSARARDVAKRMGPVVERVPSSNSLVPSPEELAEPPKLRFLAWQDENADWDWGNGRVFRSTGELVAAKDELRVLAEAAPIKVNLSGLKGGKEARVLFMWFSHPGFNRWSQTKMTLSSGCEGIPAFQNSEGSAIKTFEGQGWAICSYAAAQGVILPPSVQVRLNFTAGAWSFEPRVVMPADGKTLVGIENGQINQVGQTPEGKAFVSLVRDASQKPEVQLGFVAIAKDGRTLEPTSVMRSGGDPARTERFEFDAPIAEITGFHLRKRSVRTVEFENVSLHPEPITGSLNALSFGPAIERVVTKEIDLDTGSLKPDELKGSDHYSDALYEDPVFVFAASTQRIRLTGNVWDGFSPEQLQAALDKRFSPADTDFNRERVKLPVTLGFRTSSGNAGILQILTFTDNPRGVKIRYKLVPGGPLAMETELRLIEMPHDTPLDVNKLDFTAIERKPGVRILSAPGIVTLSGQEGVFEMTSGHSSDALAPSPVGITARLRPVLDGDTVHYAVKINVSTRQNPDDGERTMVQELSHCGDARIDQPVIVDMGKTDKGHPYLACLVFRRGNAPPRAVDPDSR